ncbi:MAG: L-2-amino-thiazoline-4-carboxylic acid hydrolase [Bacillota bacterium]
MASGNMDRLQKLEREWKTMILIAHDFFHNWRQAVCERYGEQAMEELTLRFWELVGKNTAAQYARAGIDGNDMGRLALAAARSSEIMGETVRTGPDGEAWLLLHDACPWIDSFRKAGFGGKCGPGCNRWFEATVEGLSPELAVDTLACLANGDKQCVRRFYRRR